MSDRGVVRATRRRSISESRQPRLNSTSIENDTVFNDNNLSTNQNNLSHQSQPIISHENPESYSESPMWIGIGTRLQARNLPVNNELEMVISHKFEILQSDIAHWQHLID